jgi:hypothetical protein
MGSHIRQICPNTRGFTLKITVAGSTGFLGEAHLGGIAKASYNPNAFNLPRNPCRRGIQNRLAATGYRLHVGKEYTIS